MISIFASTASSSQGASIGGVLLLIQALSRWLNLSNRSAMVVGAVLAWRKALCCLLYLLLGRRLNRNARIPWSIQGEQSAATCTSDLGTRGISFGGGFDVASVVPVGQNHLRCLLSVSHSLPSPNLISNLGMVAQSPNLFFHFKAYNWTKSTCTKWKQNSCCSNINCRFKAPESLKLTFFPNQEAPHWCLKW